MVRLNEVRPGEMAVPFPEPRDAGLVFVGRIRTPWTDRLATPRMGRRDGPVCRIEVDAPWDLALHEVELYARLEVLYWLHEARRDILRQCPRRDEVPRGAFSLRSPVRPNPIGTSIVDFVAREGSTLLVRGLDCLDGTPLLDVKPDRDLFTPLAPVQAGDFETG